MKVPLGVYLGLLLVCVGLLMLGPIGWGVTILLYYGLKPALKIAEEVERNELLEE